MMWGYTTQDGVGFISRIEGNMDASLYIEILDECIPLIQDYYDIHPEDMIFQQDNDSKHTSKKYKRLFQEERNDLTLLASEFTKFKPNRAPLELP